MSEYNIQMNKYNALSDNYDQLYPKPMKHADTHASGGTDPITPGDIGAYSKNEIDTFLASKTPILQQIPLIYLTPENMNGIREGTIALSKIGNMVMFTMYIIPESGQVEYNKIYAVLPEGYRPIKSFTFPSDNGMSASVYSEIDAAGNLRFYSDVNTSFISAELMYFSV